MIIKYSIGFMLLVSFSFFPVFGLVAVHPISDQITITEPGFYFVTNDITMEVGPIITVEASNVVIDLNGKVLTLSHGACVLVEDGRTNVTVRNGTLKGGRFGIYQTSSGGDATVTLDGLQLYDQMDQAIYLRGLLYVKFSNSTIDIGGDPDAIIIHSESGVITENVLNYSSRMWLEDMSGARITKNTFLGYVRRMQSVENMEEDEKRVQGFGHIVLCGGGGNSISGNMFSGGGGPAIWLTPGEGCTSESSNNRIVGNTINHVFEGGIVAGSGNHIWDNTITRSGDDDALYSIHVASHNTVGNNHLYAGKSGGPVSGIHVTGALNVIEGNHVGGFSGGGGSAIRFTGSSRDNAYRDNTLRGNTQAVDDQGTGNTDEGRNVF